MEQGDFRNFIKSTNSRRLIVPLVFMVFIILMFNLFDIKNWLIPLKLQDVGFAEEAYNQDKSYVSCTVGRLMYTGIDHMDDDEVDGYYYYSLIDGKCRYYLLDSSVQAKPVLENYTFSARILKEEEIAADLDRMMAESIGWTEDGVDEVASDYILSEIDYNYNNIWAITGIMGISAILAIFHVMTLLYNIINPYGAISFWHLGKASERKRIIMQANEEYNSKVIFMSQGMYVTENFFIYHDIDDFEIVALDDIVWAYKHSNLKWKIWTKHFITYNVRIVTVYRQTYTFGGKTKESSDALLDAIAALRPEILIGYSQENKVRMSN